MDPRRCRGVKIYGGHSLGYLVILAVVRFGLKDQVKDG